MVQFKKLVLASYAAIGLMLVAPLVLTVTVPVQMLTLSTFIIIIASFNGAERERQRKRDGKSADERDTIGRDQAWRFPLVASGALFGMFLAFKYLPKEWVSVLLTLYGVGFGVLAMGLLISPHLAAIPGMPKFATKEFGMEDVFTMSACDIVGIAMAAPMGWWYYTSRFWLPNNVLAVSLALSAVDALALSDFISGVVLLSGLFFYDVFWVFFSKGVFGDNVMVSVAKQFEGPIKLLFPRFLGAAKNEMSMLGLGDIVIPGLFVALTLRFDSRDLPLTSDLSKAKFSYFWTTMTAYVLGLVSTVVALNVFNAAQPALLYLVPFCVLSPLALALKRGEVKALWNYTEDEPKKDKDESAKEVKAGKAE